MGSLDKTERNEKVSTSSSSAERLAALRVSSSRKAFNYRAALLLDNIFISPAVLPGWMGQRVLAVEHPVPCHRVTPAADVPSRFPKDCSPVITGIWY